MPEDFNKCKNSGGRIRTITGPSKKFKLKKGEYRPVCIKGSKKNAKFVWGEKHKKSE